MILSQLPKPASHKALPPTLGVMRTRMPAANNRGIRGLPLLASLPAFGQHAGWTARVPAAFTATFAATKRVANRILRRSAIVRLAALPPAAAGFAQADVHVIRIANGANRGPASRGHAANFTARKTDLRPVGFPR